MAAVVAFRGSQPYELKDWLLDISFLATPVSWMQGCKAHAGFLRGFNSVSVTPETPSKQGVHDVLQQLIDGYNEGKSNGSNLSIPQLTRYVLSRLLDSLDSYMPMLEADASNCPNNRMQVHDEPCSYQSPVGWYPLDTALVGRWPPSTLHGGTANICLTSEQRCALR